MKKTAKKSSTKRAMTTTTKLEIAGAAAGAAAALGAAYYYWGSKKARQHRQSTADWMKKAEKEIVQKTGKLKKAAFNKRNYMAIVSLISERYKAMPKVEVKDLLSFTKTLNGAWDDFKMARAKADMAAKRPAAKNGKSRRKIAK
ncbi:MAG: hypothetical protein K8R92_03565 [Planctomycetes bacterium]|nr:hypothetical protein [Planctomycetota bacterium]